VFVVPLTAAVNCCVWKGIKGTFPGVSEMLTGGIREISTLASFVPSAALVAVRVTTCDEATVAGAV
jgi:hypothetical protein